jgi:exodeoxyribonuclease VIII
MLLRDAVNPDALGKGEGFGMDGLPNADYHAGPGLSVSGAKRLLKSPWHYRALALPHDAPPKAPTPAMVNGTLVHCALLEPGEFHARYVVGPDVDKRAKEWKAFIAAAGDREVITPLQHDAAMRQADALRAVPQVAELLATAGGKSERSIWWRDQLGLLRKCRPDFLAPVAHGKGAVLLDVKTASDASPEGFAKACANFHYHMQDPWYCEGVSAALGVEVHGMVFAVVESEFPHACAAYMLSDESRALGRELNARALSVYASCIASGKWPGYPQDIQVIDLPRWAFSAAQL